MLQSEKTSKDTERLIDDVGTTLLSRMVVDQEPQRLQTKSLDMVLNRLSPNSLENKTDFEEKDEGFKLPFNAITDKKAKGARFVDSVVSSLYCEYFPVNTIIKDHYRITGHHGLCV